MRVLRIKDALQIKMDGYTIPLQTMLPISPFSSKLLSLSFSLVISLFIPLPFSLNFQPSCMSLLAPIFLFHPLTPSLKREEIKKKRKKMKTLGLPLLHNYTLDF
jgi:hypothetical protein